MPPKNDKRAAEKKQKKQIEDKTFGLKNKNRSKKVQQYVQQVEKSVKAAGKNARELALEQAAKEARKNAKLEKEKQESELNSLFKVVVDGVKQAKVPENADPKSVVCAFFKAGSCKRGKACKFSHDLSQERKTAKLNIYADPRETDTIDSWDTDKLEKVVAEKHTEKPANATEIICKYFLDAIENRKYGWFWECPNGNKTCKYRHCLPPGYVLKRPEEKQQESDEEKKDISEEIEEERSKLDISKCTPVTPETFAKWKEEQRKKKEAEILAKAEAAVKQSGKHAKGVLSGRALFTYDPSLFVDDDDAAADDAYAYDQDHNMLEEEDDEKHAERLYGSDDDEENADENNAHNEAGKGDDEDENEHQGEEDESKNAEKAAALGVKDASVFLDDDVELPDDDDDGDEDEDEEEDK